MTHIDEIWGRTGRYVLLASLYLSQGLPFGFFTQALPVMLREANVSLAAIGFSTLLSLPWVLKFLWAPLIDRGPPGILARLGYRRGFILPLQLISAAALFAVGWIGDEVLAVVLAAVFFTNLFAATQDIATDGLAVDILRPAERGTGNGIQVAAYRAGMIVGGGALLVAFELLGWRAAFSLMGGLLLVATVPVALLRDRPTPEDARQSSTPPPRHHAPAVAAEATSVGISVGPTTSSARRQSLVLVLHQAKATFVDFAKRPGMGAWIVVLVAAKFGDNLATGMLRPALVDLGYSLGEIGWMVGTIGFATSLGGALAGGALVPKLGGHRAVLLFAGAQALVVSGYFVLFAYDIEDFDLMAIVVALDHWFGGMATAALFARMMDACGRRHSATDFTVQASVVVLATGIGSAFSGILAQALGYTAYFGLGAAASFACVGLMWTAARRTGALFARTDDAAHNDDDDDDDRDRGAANDDDDRLSGGQ